MQKTTPNDLVVINAGGTLVSTSRTTLCTLPTVFRTIFEQYSGAEPYFLDADVWVIRHILGSLRVGRAVLSGRSPDRIKMSDVVWRREVTRWGLVTECRIRRTSPCPLPWGFDPNTARAGRFLRLWHIKMFGPRLVQHGAVFHTRVVTSRRLHEPIYALANLGAATSRDGDRTTGAEMSRERLADWAWRNQALIAQLYRVWVQAEAAIVCRKTDFLRDDAFMEARYSMRVTLHGTAPLAQAQLDHNYNTHMQHVRSRLAKPGLAK